jgi:hypothetical protein
MTIIIEVKEPLEQNTYRQVCGHVALELLDHVYRSAMA